MLQPVILLVIAAAVALVVAFPLGDVLRHNAWVFYAIAVLIVCAFATCRYAGLGGAAFRWVAPLVQKGYLASMFLWIVMFIGVFPEQSSIRRSLQPIRGELSVISSILFLGHLATYAIAYFPRLQVTMGFQPLLGAAIIVAIPLTCVFVVLSVTSLKSVKRRMSANAWKAIQRLSYLMVALVIVHVFFALGRSAADGSALAMGSLVAYAAIAVVYAVMRIRKAVIDKAAVA